MSDTRRRPRYVRVVTPVVGIAAFALFAALLMWWPSGTCNDASCARKRFELFVEMDSFRGVEPLALEVDSSDGPVSAQSILRSGGIDLTIEQDDENLPYDPASGPLDRADLYQYATAWRTRSPASARDAHVYALIAPALISDRGEPLFGIMFDSQDREGVAIAPTQTSQTFKLDSELIPLLTLRTFTHELLHALNRRHIDATSLGDGRLTIEAPTRCITVREGVHWRLSEEPSMALSPKTIAFFQSASARDVLPGGANTPFDVLRSSASECADIRAARANPLASRWELARQRVLKLVGIDSARAQPSAVKPSPGSTPLDAASFLLLIQAQEAAYPLGYPIAIRVIAQNRSSQSTPLKGRLTPPYGLVRIEYRERDSEQWHAFKPLMWFEPASDEGAELEPGGYAEQTAAIYFGDDGWTFPKVGDYELRARVKPSEESADIISNTIAIAIAAPNTDAERATLQPLLNTQGELNAEVGRLLTFGGRITDEAAYAAIQASVDRQAVMTHDPAAGGTQTSTHISTHASTHASTQTATDTALGSALKLTLGSQRLSPPIDPLTGERPKPRFADAHRLLDDTCTDSGIAALKFELLERFKEDLPNRMRQRLQSGAAAWDGATRDHLLVPSYSDPGLRRSSTSLHFCVNEAQLRRDVRPAARQVAVTLAALKPRRVVIVGHADNQGQCRFNDDLALQRAEAVRRELLRAGLARESIATVSLGERRPLDFSDTQAARTLNRRVEILYEPPTSLDETQVETDSLRLTDVERALPRCAT